MKKLLLFATLLFFASCSGQYHTVKVKKPRIHHSWYKNHRYRKNIQIGKYRFDIFDRQGTRTVKMKG